MPAQIRKIIVQVDETRLEMGRAVTPPTRRALAMAVIANPYAGRYEPDLLPFMAELRTLGRELAEELVQVLGRDQVQAYGKAAIVGVNGELEHGAVWHEAGGWAMRTLLGDPKAIVPAAKAVASAGYRLMVPLHYIHAAYVRSHFNSAEVGIQDAPRPDEILFALVMADGGRIHARLGGLTRDQVTRERVVALERRLRGVVAAGVVVQGADPEHALRMVEDALRVVGRQRQLTCRGGRCAGKGGRGGIGLPARPFFNGVAHRI